MKRGLSVGLVLSLILCFTMTGYAAPSVTSDVAGVQVTLSVDDVTDTTITVYFRIGPASVSLSGGYGLQFTPTEGTPLRYSLYNGIYMGSLYDTKTLTLEGFTRDTEYYVQGYIQHYGFIYLSDGVTVTTLHEPPVTPTPEPTPIPTPTPAPTAVPTSVPTAVPTLKPTPVPLIDVKSVKTLPTLYLVKGKTITLPAAVQPFNADDKLVTWVSKDRKIAKVGENTGKVTGVKVGKTVLTVTTDDGGKTAKCTVYVVAKAMALKTLSITPSKPTSLRVGKTLQVKPMLSPAKVTGIVPTFASSVKKVATIDKLGVITALAKGKTTITVKVGKKTKQFTLSVT